MANVPAAGEPHQAANGLSSIVWQLGTELLWGRDIAGCGVVMWTVFDPKILDPPGVHICPILAVTAIIWSLLAKAKCLRCVQGCSQWD
jgi:hypothetical protein